MSEDTLAQNEIDALINAAGGAVSKREKKKGLADEIAEEFKNSSKKIFLSFLGIDISIEKIESGAVPIDIISQELSESLAIAFVDSKRGIQTSAVLIFDEKKMTKVTDLIFMGEGKEKEKFSDDDIDALKEAVNQIMGNLGQSISIRYLNTVSFKQAEIKLLSHRNALTAIKEKIKEDSLYRILYSLRIKDKVDMRFHLILPLSIERQVEELAKSLIEKKAETAELERKTYQEIPDSEDKDIEVKNLDLILDLNVEIIVKLGETMRTLNEITKLVKGNILTLDKVSDAPVDIIINNKTIAKGELVVIPPNNFAIKVTEVKGKNYRIN